MGTTWYALPAERRRAVLDKAVELHEIQHIGDGVRDMLTDLAETEVEPDAHV